MEQLNGQVVKPKFVLFDSMIGRKYELLYFFDYFLLFVTATSSILVFMTIALIRNSRIKIPIFQKLFLIEYSIHLIQTRVFFQIRLTTIVELVIDIVSSKIGMQNIDERFALFTVFDH